MTLMLNSTNLIFINSYWWTYYLIMAARWNLLGPNYHSGWFFKIIICQHRTIHFVISSTWNSLLACNVCEWENNFWRRFEHYSVICRACELDAGGKCTVTFVDMYHSGEGNKHRYGFHGTRRIIRVACLIQTLDQQMLEWLTDVRFINDI